MIASGATVLAVDDDPDDRFLLEQAWRQAGIGNPLRTIDDGPGLVDYLSGSGAYSDRTRYPLPAMILLDIKMPGMSGLDVLKWLRAQESLRRVPVLILTASTAPTDVTEAYRLGASCFFIKPSALDELIELLKAVKNCWLRFNQFPEI